MKEVEVFLELTTVPELYVTFPVASCGDEVDFLKLSLIKTKLLSTTAKDRLQRQSVVEKGVTEVWSQLIEVC